MPALQVMAGTVDSQRVAERFDSEGVFDEKVRKVASLVRSSKHTVFFTGAGVSTSAGIPDYRGPSGCWTRRKIKELQAKAASSSLTSHEERELQSFREEQAKEVQKAIAEKKKRPKEYLDPGFSHRAIATLMRKGLAHYCITTNLDGLFRKAGLMAHEELCCLHGDIFTERCSSCGYEFERNYRVRVKERHVHDHHRGTCERCGSAVPSQYTGMPVDGARTGSGHGFEETHLVGVRDRDVGTRDTHINFGELLDERDLVDCATHCDRAELCIVLGTSMTLRHITHFPFMAKDTVIVNLQATPDEDRVSEEMRLWGTCDGFLQKLMDQLDVRALEPEVAWKPRDALSSQMMRERKLGKAALSVGFHIYQRVQQIEAARAKPSAEAEEQEYEA